MKRKIISGLLAATLGITGCSTLQPKQDTLATHASKEMPQAQNTPKELTAKQKELVARAQINYLQEIMNDLDYSPNLKRYHWLLEQHYEIEQIVLEEHGTNLQEVIIHKYKEDPYLRTLDFPAIYLKNLDILREQIQLPGVNMYRTIEKQKKQLEQSLERNPIQQPQTPKN